MTAEPNAEVDDLDAAYAEIRREPYLFKWVGRQWSLPHIGELDYRLQAEIEDIEDLSLERVNDLFKRLFGPEQADDWERATQPGAFLSILFERWVKHSGRKQGEEPASEPSSESTGANSKPTSTASTTSASPKRSTAKPAKAAPRKAAKRAPRKAVKPSAAELAAKVDAEWLERHQVLAGSPLGNSST